MIKKNRFKIKKVIKLATLLQNFLLLQREELLLIIHSKQIKMPILPLPILIISNIATSSQYAMVMDRMVEKLVDYSRIDCHFMLTNKWRQPYKITTCVHIRKQIQFMRHWKRLLSYLKKRFVTWCRIRDIGKYHWF